MAAVVEGPTEVHGLREAVLLLDSQGADRLDVVVVSVEVRQAPALLQLINTQTQKADGWNVSHDQKLRHLARISCEVDALLDVVFPLLKDEPKSDVGGRLVTRYGWSLRRLGLKVDGHEGLFYTAVRPIGNALRRHTYDVHDATKRVGSLKSSLGKIEERLHDLKRTNVIIPKVQDDDEEGEEEEEDDDFDGDVNKE